MTQVIAEMSMSLDGYITGPNHSARLPLGKGGERLHEWIYELTSWRELHGLAGGEFNQDAELIAESNRRTGAVILGRTMFDHGHPFWGDTPPFHMPVFILTHEARPAEIKNGGTTYTFVTDGIERALEHAKAAAGSKDVKIAGGANLIQQYIEAGLLDELLITLVPILLGNGQKLFEHIHSPNIEFIRTAVIESPNVTHLRFRLFHHANA
ncbi:dihydrofolate reductase family protein [Paenibacillus lautus]|uniref:dihydrofolate reductase family protein n=1 Tax=Paenibacillus lautus TaxID=1401 RepID=UPI003D2C897C